MRLEEQRLFTIIFENVPYILFYKHLLFFLLIFSVIDIKQTQRFFWSVINVALWFECSIWNSNLEGTLCISVSPEIRGKIAQEIDFGMCCASSHFSLSIIWNLWSGAVRNGSKTFQFQCRWFNRTFKLEV